MTGIYKITNLINGKCYIGQSINIERRWQEHKNTAFNTNSDRYEHPLYRAIRKYGMENFKFEVIEECIREQLNEKEISYISQYNSNNKNNGYNQDSGGFTPHTLKVTPDLLSKIICKLKETTESYAFIAKEFNLSESVIWNINNGYPHYCDTNEHYPVREYIQIPANIVYCQNCGTKLVNTESQYCKDCFNILNRKVKRPSPLELGEQVKEMGFKKVGELYGVSGPSVSRWCKVYGIPHIQDELIAWYNQQVGIIEEVKTKTKYIKKRLIEQIDPVSGNVVGTFEGPTAAVHALGRGKASHISEACRGLHDIIYGFKWRYVDNTSDEKLSQYDLLNNKISEKKDLSKKPVLQIDMNTNKIIATFASLIEASQSLNKGKKGASYISKVCNGLKESAYGFKWQFVDNEDKISSKKRSDNGRKPVYQLNPLTNEVITYFESAAAAGAFLNKKRASASISNVCNGRGNTAYGSKWCYVEDYIPPAPTSTSST